MEYNHSGVGTIVQSTWWVQCTHVHVVMAMHTGKVIVAGDSGWGDGRGGVVIEQRVKEKGRGGGGGIMEDE